MRPALLRPKREHFLIVRNDRLGDAMLALPVVISLKSTFPEAKISFLAAPGVAPLIECVEGVDHVFQGLDRARNKELEVEFRTADITTAICLRPTLSNALLLFRAAIPVRIGTSRRAYSALFNLRVHVKRRGMLTHETELNFQLLEELSIAFIRTFPPFNLPQDSVASADKLLKAGILSPDKPIVVLHPGTGGSAREWPPQFFHELGVHLAKEGISIVITGSQQEMAKCTVAAGNEYPNLAGATDLLTLASVLNRAALVVASSTGPLHLAIALGRPVVGLYPPVRDALPERWGPYGHPEWAMKPEVPICRECKGGAVGECWCMEQLEVEQVAGRALKMLRFSEQ